MSIGGIGACVLGYADDEVDGAVIEAIRNGVASSLNCPEEVELAEELCALHPWADMARFTRGGGEALSVAVRIARAHTGRDVVAFCGYHGWSDWYLAASQPVFPAAFWDRAIRSGTIIWMSLKRLLQNTASSLPQL